MLEIEGYAKPTSQPAVAPEIASLLSAFDRGALEILAAPEKYFDVAMEIENADPDAAEPWRAAFSITSKAKFPIPLGADGLINPVFLLSFRADADKMRDFPALFAVTLDRRRYLPPGETIRAQRTLDVGPLHTIARRFPQQAVRVEIQAIFDPGIQTDGRWSPSAMGRALRPAALTRRIVDARGASVSARLESLLDKYPPTQFVSIEVLAELLGERQRYELHKLSYAPLAAVSTDRIMAALRGQLQSESWEARVRTLDALQSAGLDAPTFAAVQNCLQHSHWLVRFAAVRLLARQGESFQNEAAKIAESDSDAVVREMARAALLRWARPESQPAPVSRPADDAD
ncbi:MAG: HEAT repeat domain-containing protein [Planctomycetes bacterium]|nr:HEAT repeat domain-containing protein [Planctomycetota bacterium]